VNGSQRADISQRVNSAACAIRYYLTERHPDLTASVLRWVESIVVFTHPLCHVEASDAPATIVRYSQLYQAVLELSRKHRLAPGTAGQLAETLAKSQPARGGAAVEGRGGHIRVLIRSIASSVWAREPNAVSRK
jgi:hypothetical protein